MDNLKKLIREVPDFPKPGINFYDITTLLKDPEGFEQTIDALTEMCRGIQVDTVIGVESRGFIFAAPLAYQLGAGFIPVRKPKKLPAEIVSVSYELEYGTDTLEMHKDAVGEGHRVLIVDDLLATGGTAKAVVDLVEGFADQMNAESARLDEIERATLQPVRVTLRAEIAQTKDDTVFTLLTDETDKLVGFLMVGVTDYVRARFVESQHDQILLHFGKTERFQKLPDEIADQAKITWMTGKFDFALHGKKPQENASLERFRYRGCPLSTTAACGPFIGTPRRAQ